MALAGGINSKAMALIVGIITVIVILSILSATSTDLFGNVADFVQDLNDPNVTTNDTTANAIKPVFGTLVGIAFILALVGLPIAAFAFLTMRGGKGG